MIRCPVSFSDVWFLTLFVQIHMQVPVWFHNVKTLRIINQMPKPMNDFSLGLILECRPRLHNHETFYPPDDDTLQQIVQKETHALGLKKLGIGRWCPTVSFPV